MNPSDDQLRTMMDRMAEVQSEDHGASGRRIRFGRRGIMVAVAVVIALGLGWGLTRWTAPPVSPDDVPFIAADPAPTKHRPEEPGGTVIPYQDTEVYDLIDPAHQEVESVERLLPPPEEPVVAAMPEAEAPEAAVPEAVVSEVAPQAEQATIGTLLEETAEPAVEAVETDIAALEAAPETTAPWRVQVGAVKDATKVDAEWARIKAKLGDAITGLPTTVESVDLGADQGVYHRLQIGAFAARDDAEALCARIKQQFDCLVVQR